MRLLIAAVGRLRGGPEAALIENYATRIRAAGRAVGIREFIIREVEGPKGISGSKRTAREGSLLLEATNTPAKTVALDENGRAQSSEEFAGQLAHWRDEGAGEIVYYIGGADGHGSAILNEADFQLSFGRATWPHMLARAMLCEQVYRAITILSGHPYHRS